MANRVIGFCFLVFFFLLFFFIPWQISVEGVPPNSPAPVSPRFFPRILAVFGVILSILLIGKSMVASRASDEDLEIPTKGNLLRILALNAFIAFNLLTFDLLGYLISTSLTLIFMMAFLGLKEVKYFVLIIAILPPAIYYLFKKLLYVPFPAGLLGF